MATIIRNNADNQFILATLGADKVVSGAGNDKIYTYLGNDTVNSGDGDDIIFTGMGDDTVVSMGGDNHVNAGIGNDTVTLGNGKNTVFTGIGDDKVTTGSGNDYIDAGVGHNDVNAGDGNNTVITYTGNDTITTGAGDDTIRTGAGQDTIKSGAGNDWINAGFGNDVVYSGAGDDLIYGKLGDDYIDAGSGNDEVWAGLGNDTAVFSAKDNVGDKNYYNGGILGHDTLILKLTRDEFENPEFQREWQHYQKFAENPLFLQKLHFTFFSLDLKIYSWECVKLQVAVKAVDDAVTTAEDNAVTIDVLDNDLGTGMQISPASLTAANGSVTLVDGKLVYVPAANFFGSDEITYQVTDSYGNTSTAKVAVTVTPVNDAPVADDIARTLDEDSVMTGILPSESNASDIDGDTLSYSLVTAAQHGEVNLNTDGTYTYTPAANYNGQDSFIFKVSDGNGGEVIRIVTLTITPVNDAPTANDVAVTIAEDNTLTGNLQDESQAIDIDGDALTFALVSGAAHGDVTLNTDGAYTYTPVENYNGTDSFTFKVSDGKGGEVTQTVRIDVTPVNDAPMAQDSARTTEEDTVVTGNLAVESQAQDIDGDALTYGVVTQAQHGVVILQANGEYTYTPAQNYHGKDLFTYKISDGKGGETVQTLNITVTPVNDAPTANDVTHMTPEDVVLTGNVLNESQAADIDGDALKVSLTDAPQHGQITLAENGDYTYTPNENFNGKDSFSFTVNDGQGGDVTKTVTIDVIPVNDAPTADAVAKTIDEDVVLTGQLALESNAADVDGDILSYSLETQAAHGVVVLQADGSYTYTPAENYNGADSFSFTVNDGQGGTVTQTVSITVNPVNDMPTANDVVKMTDEDTVLIGNLLAESNASDVDGDAFVFTLKTPASQGVVVLSNDGQYTYTPSENFHGVDSFTFTIDDGNGGTITQTAKITVNPVNDLPQLTVDTAEVEEAKQVTVDVLANDSDVEGALTLTDVNITSGKGTVSIVNNQLVYKATDYDALNEGEKAQVSVTYTVTDTDGATATSQADITVIGKGQLETKPDEITVSENGSVVFDVLANDTSDNGSALTLVSVTGGATGDIVEIRDNKLYVEPVNRDALAEGETVSYTVNYVASDSLSQQQGTATVTVTGENDAPVAANDVANQVIVMNPTDNTPTLSGTLVNGLGGDAGFGETKISGADDQFSEKIDLSSVFKEGINFNGQLYSGIYINANGNITFERPDIRFTPENINAQTAPMIAPFWADVALTNSTVNQTTGGNSTGSNSIYYDLDANKGIVTITWDDVSYFGANTTNDKRNAFQLQLINQGNGDFDIVFRYEDVNWTTGNSSQGVDGLGGVVARAGYTDAKGNFVELAASGKQADMLTLETTQGNTGIAGAWQFSVQNGAVVDAPTVRINVLNNDTDIDNQDELRVISASVRDGLGTVTLEGNELVYTPASDYNSLDAGQVKDVVLEYTIADKAGAQSTATVKVPVQKGGLITDTAIVTENQSVTIDVLQNDVSNGDWTLNTVKVVDGNGEAKVVDGKVVYTASNQVLAENEQGTVKLLYQATDSNGVIASEFVNVTVNGTRNLTAVLDTAEVQEHKTVTIDVLANDFGEKDGDKLTVSKAQLVDGYGAVNIVDGKVVFNPDDRRYFNLSGDQTSQAKIQYSIVDERGNESTNFVDVTVQAAPNPIARDDVTIRVNEDTPVNIKELILANDISVSGGEIEIYNTRVIQSGVGYLDQAGNFRPSSFGPQGNQFLYTEDMLKAGEERYVGIRYNIRDSYGGISKTAGFTVIVEGSNDPTAIPDAFVVYENETAEFDVLANDTPLDASRPLAIDAFTIFGSNYFYSTTSLTSEYGYLYKVGNKFSFIADGRKSEALNSGESVDVSFSYRASDGKGGYAIQRVTVTIKGKDEPIANKDIVTVKEGESITIDSLANDINVNNGFLTITSVKLVGDYNKKAYWSPNQLDAENVTLENNQIQYIAGEYDYSYRGAQGFHFRNGQDVLAEGESVVRKLVYTIEDGKGGKSQGEVEITVQGKNDPIAVNDIATVAEDGSVEIDVLANDTIIDGNSLNLLQVGVESGRYFYHKYYNTVINGVHSRQSGGIAIENNKVVFNPNGYDALKSGESKDVVINYLATDGKGGTAQGSVTVTVTGRADIQPDVAVVKENGSVTVDVLANDYSAFGDGEKLILSSSGSGRYINGRRINSDIDVVDNKLVISPKGYDDLKPGESRDVKVNYSVKDSLGNTASSYVTLTVEGSQDPNVIQDKFTVKERSLSTLDVLQNDVPLSADPKHKLTIVDVWENQFNIDSSSFSIVDNQIQFNSTGIFRRFTTQLDEGELANTKIYYAIRDNDGGYQEGSVELTIEGRANTDTDFLLVGNDNDNTLDFTAQTSVKEVATGGTGADVFNLSITQDKGDKAITDLSLSQGDQLQISDVLDSDGNGEINVADLNAMVGNNGITEISVHDETEGVHIDIIRGGNNDTTVVLNNIHATSLDDLVVQGVLTF